MKTVKRCSHCKFEKPLSEFYKHKSREDGLRDNCKECCKESRYKWVLENREKCLITSRRSYQKHKTKRNKENIEYKIKNADSLRILRIDYNNSPDRKNISKEYRKTPTRKATVCKNEHKKRGIGYNPINHWFEGSHYHTFEKDEKSLGVYIPSELHQRLRHNMTTGKGMTEINKASLSWLCEQVVI